MNRLEKEALVSDITDLLDKAQLVVVATQKCLTVEKSTQLRSLMREGKAHLKVVKNSLLQLAVKNGKWEGIAPFLVGPTIIGYSTDPIAAAKVLVPFCEKNESLKVLGGVLNERVLSFNEVKALASLPSLDQLRATIIGVVTAPAAKIARTVLEPAAQLARLAGAYSRKES